MSADGEHNFCGMLSLQTVYVIYSCRAGRAAEPDTRLDMTMKLRFCRKVLHLLAGHRDNRQQSSWNSSSNSVHVFFKENVKMSVAIFQLLFHKVHIATCASSTECKRAGKKIVLCSQLQRKAENTGF